MTGKREEGGSGTTEGVATGSGTAEGAATRSGTADETAIQRGTATGGHQPVPTACW